MAGNRDGGLKARTTNQHRHDEEYLEKYGMTFYQYIGQMGGRNGNTGGFRYMKENGQEEKIRAAGAKGGKVSRRGKANENA